MCAGSGFDPISVTAAHNIEKRVMGVADVPSCLPQVGFRFASANNSRSPDGLYKIVYPSDTQLLREFDEALAVVRGGSVLCSDRNGGVYHGAGVLDADQRCFRLDMTIDVPAGRELVTGFSGKRAALKRPSSRTSIHACETSVRSFISMARRSKSKSPTWAPCRIERPAASVPHG